MRAQRMSDAIEADAARPARRVVRAAVLGAAVAALNSGCGRPPAPPPAATVTLRSLAAELGDETAIARLDRPSARLYSSFDPSGRNEDYNHFLRVDPDGWAVLADLEGPGYVSRFWTTGQADGRHPLRMYFDGESEPRIETTLDDWCGGRAPFQSPLAAYEPYCWYSWTPVPYRERLVIKSPPRSPGQEQPKFFFQIAAHRLPRGRTTESWPKSLTEDDRRALEDLRERLSRRTAPAAPWPAERATKQTAAPGMTVRWPEIRGPTLIRRIHLRPDFSAAPTAVARHRLLRQLALEIRWNRAAEPSVRAPLGDLFGSVGQPRQMDSFFFGMEQGRYALAFPMPFERSAEIAVRNESEFAVPIELAVETEPLERWDAGWGYFHAAWDWSAETGTPHTVLSARGRGHYAGCILSVTSLAPSWWVLEGDELMRLDNEPQPSWRGTGLEDYFNGGWYYGSAIARPFHGLIHKAHFRTVQYRIHQADPVAFRRSIHVAIERGPDNASPAHFESVAFYYASAPSPAAGRRQQGPFPSPPNDPVEPYAVMTGINDLERLGDYDGAEEYTRSVLERMRHPFSEVLRLRLLFYEERRRGFEAVAERYAAFLRETPHEGARRQLEDWLWLRENPAHALLIGYCNTASDLFLDGARIGEAGDPQRASVYRVVLADGPHALAVRAAYRVYPYWVYAALLTRDGIVATGRDWRFAFDPDGAWMAAGFDDSGWREVGGPEFGKGPPEEPYIWLEPLAFVGALSAGRGIWVSAEWPDRSRPAVFRRAFRREDLRPRPGRAGDGPERAPSLRPRPMDGLSPSGDGTLGVGIGIGIARKPRGFRPRYRYRYRRRSLRFRIGIADGWVVGVAHLGMSRTDTASVG